MRRGFSAGARSAEAGYRIERERRKEDRFQGQGTIYFLSPGKEQDSLSRYARFTLFSRNRLLRVCFFFSDPDLYLYIGYRIWITENVPVSDGPGRRNGRLVGWGFILLRHAAPKRYNMEGRGDGDGDVNGSLRFPLYVPVDRIFPESINLGDEHICSNVFHVCPLIIAYCNEPANSGQPERFSQVEQGNTDGRIPSILSGVRTANAFHLVKGTRSCGPKASDGLMN